MELAGRTAVVTGATSGIGRCIVEGLAGRRVNVCLVGRDEGRLGALEGQLQADHPGIQTCHVVMDLAGDISKPIESLLTAVPAVDVLVHCAGAVLVKNLADTSDEDFDLQYRVNVRSPFILTRALLPAIRQARGQVVFVNSSVAHQRAAANLTAYAASKYAQKAIADSLREAANADGVRVLSVYPGRTATPMQEYVFRSEGRDYRPDSLLQPEDVADTVISALSMAPTAEVTDVMVRPMRKS